MLRSEKLIHQMLPKTMAENLKYGRATSEMFESATILFSEVSVFLLSFSLYFYLYLYLIWICLCIWQSFLRLTASTTWRGPAPRLTSLRCLTLFTKLLTQESANMMSTRQEDNSIIQFKSIGDVWTFLQVETINDSYMVASGLPVQNGDKHPSEVTQAPFLPHLSLHLIWQLPTYLSM